MGFDPTFVLILLIAAIILQLLAAGLWARVVRFSSFRWPWILLTASPVFIAGAAGALLADNALSASFEFYEGLLAIIFSIAGALFVISGIYLPPRIIEDIQTLGEVQRSRDLFMAIFDSLPNPAVAKDAALRYLAVNPAFARFLGKDRDTILGETDAAFFPRSQSHQFNKADQKVILSGQPTSTETEVLGAEGRRWLLFDRIPLGEAEDVRAILVHAADLTEQKKREFNQKHALDTLQKLNQVTIKLLNELSLRELQDKILAEAVALTGIPNACFAVPDQDAHSLTIKAGVGSLSGAIDLKFDLEEDVPGKVWQSGQALEINDYPNWPGRSPQFRSFKFGTVLGVPIRIGADVVAVLLLAQAEGTESFAKGVLTQTLELAKISASVLRNARAVAAMRSFSEEQSELVQTLKHRARFEHLLAAIASHFINLPADKISNGVRQALQAIGKLIQADRGYLYLYPELDYPGDHIITWEAQGTDTSRMILSGFQPSRFPWWIGKLTRSETVYVRDPETLPPEASALADFLKEHQIHSFTTVPLIAERAVVGFLGFDSLQVTIAHSPDELTLLEAAGETLINALTRAREVQKQAVNVKGLAAQVKRLEQRNLEHTLITEMGELLAASRTADEAYPIVARYTKRLIPVGSGTLYTLENPEDPAQPAAKWGDKNSPDAELVLNECWALRRGRSHLVTDPEAGPNCHHLTTPFPAAYLCVPLIAQGEAVGLLHLSLNSEPPEGAQNLADYQSLAEMIAEHIALTLSNLTLRDQLRSQAIRDPLTGLFNRRYMEETLVRELRRATRQKTSVGVIMFDIDGLKPINDNHGHDAGDSVLRSLGRLMIKMFRGEDVPCRYGGDEFTLILPEASLADTWQRAEQLREAFKNLPLEHEGKSLNPITMSIGAVAFPDHGETADELVQAGDVAAYLAKGEGGDRVMLGKSNDNR